MAQNPVPTNRNGIQRPSREGEQAHLCEARIQQSLLGRQRLQEKQRQGHPMVETGMQFLSKFILSLDCRLSINLTGN